MVTRPSTLQTVGLLGLAPRVHPGHRAPHGTCRLGLAPGVHPGHRTPHGTRQLGLAPWARPDTAHPEYSLRFMRGRLDALPSCGTSSVNSVLAIMKKKLSKK